MKGISTPVVGMYKNNNFDKKNPSKVAITAALRNQQMKTENHMVIVGSKKG